MNLFANVVSMLRALEHQRLTPRLYCPNCKAELYPPLHPHGHPLASCYCPGCANEWLLAGWIGNDKGRMTPVLHRARIFLGQYNAWLDAPERVRGKDEQSRGLW